jgi:DNA-binding NarL/FixJ family response regulator
MAAPPATRVLIVDFGSIARQGFRETLTERGFDVVAGYCAVDEVAERMRAEEPDVVVIDLDGQDTAGVIEAITDDFPETKVIACSAEQPRMRVYPRAGAGDSYLAQLDPETLSSAVQE